MPQPAADRNLLFGILALQLDFIAGDALVAAMHAWVIDKERPLGEILVAHGALQPETHDVLDALVRKHLEKHGDCQQSLASIGSLGSARQELERITDSDLHASLNRVSADRRPHGETWSTRHPPLGKAVGSPRVETSLSDRRDSSSAGGPTAAGLDLRAYQLTDLLGEGGMGDVYRARDPALGRDLAVKILKADARADPSAERRFVREARVAGSLQHPGITPVHNLGRLPDGRLFFTMKLVRGRTLADFLAESIDRPECLPGLLATFEKVCQAVAYAHSRGVVHRDLKPANIMVGKYGEVQVMDWGLAKVLPWGEGAAEESADETRTIVRTESSDGPAEVTRHGHLLGTPAYMPPEQARGEVALIDERSDVFALGAILCQVLTGQPPYEGHAEGESLLCARRGDVAKALGRLDRSDADASLRALCRDCLRADPVSRPRDAGAVAERVAVYQTEVRERLRRAELEGARAEVKAQEERKRRRQALGLSAAVLFVLLVGMVASTLFGLDARRQAGIATKHAEDAAREKRKAEAKTKEVEDKERIATQARDEAELALLLGLLRPIGHTTEALGPAEANALTELHNLTSDALRVRFIEVGLRTPEAARRLDQRATWVIQAAVALDGGRRSRVLEVLMRHLREREAPEEVREACVSLGIALEARDPSFEEIAGEAIVATTVRSLSRGNLGGLSARLYAAAGRLDAAHAGEAADAIRVAMGNTSDENTLRELSGALKAIAGRLDAAHAGKASEALLAAMRKIREPDDLRNLAWGLAALADRLGAAAAAAYAGKAADTILAAMSKIDDPDDLRNLAWGLEALAERLDAPHANKAAHALLTAMSQTTDPDDLRNLAWGLEALVGRMEADPDGKAIDTLVAALRKAKKADDLRSLSFALYSVAARLTADQTGKAADAILTAMNKFTGGDDLRALSFALHAVADRLDPEAAAVSAGKAADIILAAMRKAKDAEELRSLSFALYAVAGRLDAVHAGKAADAIRAAMNKATNPAVQGYPYVLAELSLALGVVAGRLDGAAAAAHTGEAADALLAALDNTSGENARRFLSWGLRAVAGSLDAVHAGKAADAILAAMSKTTDADELRALSQALRSLCERQTTPALLALLGQPLAAGSAQRAVLDVLGRRTRREFQNTWHFLDWIRSNGVDLAPPPPVAVAETAATSRATSALLCEASYPDDASAKRR